MEPWLTKDPEGISPFERECAVTGQWHSYKDVILVPLVPGEVYIHRSQIENYVNYLGYLDAEEKELLIKELKEL